jgi:hypothetical protein
LQRRNATSLLQCMRPRLALLGRLGERRKASAIHSTAVAFCGA